MPVVNVYLDDELFDLVRKNKSKIIQQALKAYKAQLEQQKKQQTSPSPA